MTNFNQIMYSGILNSGVVKEATFFTKKGNYTPLCSFIVSNVVKVVYNIETFLPGTCISILETCKIDAELQIKTFRGFLSIYPNSLYEM